jgi:hypothetical protein
LDDLPESFHPTLKAVRSSEGEALVLDENMFIEKMLPGVTQRTLSVDDRQLGPIRPGQPVQIRVDAISNRTFLLQLSLRLQVLGASLN